MIRQLKGDRQTNRRNRYLEQGRSQREFQSREDSERNQSAAKLALFVSFAQAAGFVCGVSVCVQVGGSQIESDCERLVETREDLGRSSL